MAGQRPLVSSYARLLFAHRINLGGDVGRMYRRFHQVEALISDYIHSGRYLNTRVMDQHFYVIVSGQPYVRVL